MSERLLFFFLFLAGTACSQPIWEERWHVAINDESTWDADRAGNVYVFNGEAISKLDTSGKQLLTQSAKSFGTIKTIDASNWMKIAVFSEEQQQVCYLDNALGIQPDCIELAETGVMLAQHVATSTQTDRIWVYDQLNSELQLITLRSNQRQIIQNLRSLIDLGIITQLFEYENVLYVIDEAGQIASFDNYGTFINGFDLQADYVQPFAKGWLFSKASVITATDAEEEKVSGFFELPSGEAIVRFFFTGKWLYVSTTTNLYCFALAEAPKQ